MSGEFTELNSVREIGGTAEVIRVTRAAAIPATLNPDVAQALVIPADAQLVEPDLSAWREAPVRRTGTYRPATVEALIDYVAWLMVKDQTTVWVHPTSGKVEAVFDDNGVDPGYRQHRALLQLQPTPEWTYWAENDTKMMGQEEFAEHIEGGLEEIATPDAADMLEIAQSFHASKEASFRQSNRLTSGEQRLQYDETIQASAGKTGDLTVPTVILLAVAPFYGEDRYKVTARLRFRLSGGKLTLGYMLDRPESVKRDALEGIAERLSEKFERTFVGEAP